MSLKDVGMSSEQERLYRSLLRDPRSRLVDKDMHAVADELRALGLIDDSLVPVPPAVAVELLIRRRMEQVTRDLHRLSGAWDLVRDLAEEQRSGRPGDFVERLDDSDEVRRRIQQFRAREEVLNIRDIAPGVPLDDGQIHDFRRRLAGGLVGRTIIPVDALNDPEESAYVREQHRLGDLHRVTTEPVKQVLILDRTVAFLRRDPYQRPSGALVIRQPGAVQTLVELFEYVWRHARDIDAPDLTPIERQVLHALVQHPTDEAAARSVNISVRKFRGHVADLMTRLGAASRFQAALRAKERGWI